jgi:hypothetical protein
MIQLAFSRVRRSFLAAIVAVSAATISTAVEPCRVEVVDRENGWPVPLVELRTTHDVALVTDNAGVVAIDQPELMGRETWFHVSSHGYSVPKDGFGYSGVRLTPEPGATLRVEVDRTIVAKRLGLLTGAGLFAESQKLGGDADWQESGVFGCDSVQMTVHRDRCFWLWGDTDLARYPLGVFNASSATTERQPIASLEPPVRVKYDYFLDDAGLPRGVANINGEGPTWLSGYVSIPNRHGEPRLVATYAKIRGYLEAYEIGLCAWNEDRQEFGRMRILWMKTDAAPQPPQPYPDGHVVLWRDDDGSEWLLFGNPFPTMRCPATFEAWQDAGQWEPLEKQAHLVSAADGERVEPHTGSIAYNEFRQRWVTVFMQALGKPSGFGELWYAEAPTPLGPWGPAVKVLSHENYTFYNPRLHQEFTDPESPVLLFEGTFTTTFADKPAPTPRYDYNQILYRLDLDDPALAPAHVTDAAQPAAQ